MVTITWATPEDYDSILPFANAIFDHSVQPGGFPEVLPKIYDNRPELARQHLIIRDNGEIMGLLLCHVQTLSVAGQKIKIAGIGTVSVSPKARGKGYMGQLLDKSQEFLEQEGVVLSALSGERQRYENYGYFPSGLQVRGKLEPNNLRHVLGEKAPVSLKPLVEESPEFSEAFRIHNAQPHHVLRGKEDFIAILSSWRAKPYSILKAGKVIGYLTVVKEDNTLRIDEILLQNTADLLDVCASIVTEFDKSSAQTIEFSNIPFFQNELATALLNYCEAVSIVPNKQYNILDFRTALQGYLTLKNQYAPLSDGLLRLSVDNTPLLIAIEQGDVRVEAMEETESGMVTLTKKEATQLLFSVDSFLPTKLNAPCGLVSLTAVYHAW